LFFVRFAIEKHLFRKVDILHHLIITVVWTIFTAVAVFLFVRSVPGDFLVSSHFENPVERDRVKDCGVGVAGRVRI